MNYDEVMDLMPPNELPRPLDLSRRLSDLSDNERVLRRDLRIEISRIYMDRWVACRLFQIDYEPMNLLVDSARIGISNTFTRRYPIVTTQLRAMAFENRAHDDQEPTRNNFTEAFEELHDEFYDSGLDARWTDLSRFEQEEFQDVWTPCILCGLASPAPHNHASMTVVPSPEGSEPNEEMGAEEDSLGWTSVLTFDQLERELERDLDLDFDLENVE